MPPRRPTRHVDQLPTLWELSEATPLRALDAGAAGGLAAHWIAAGTLMEAHAVEPDTRAWTQPGATGPDVVWHGVALAGADARRQLHVTKTPTGSSLLPPRADMMARFSTPQYHGVSHMVDVDCQSIPSLRAAAGIEPFDLVKLDTQGTELEILSGLAADDWSRLALLEVEVEFLELYQGQPLFTDIHELLSSQDFELLDLRTHREYRVGPSGGRHYLRQLGAVRGNPRFGAQLVAGDAVYIPSPTALLDRGPAAFARLVIALLLYSQHDLALWLVDLMRAESDIDAVTLDAVAGEIRGDAPRPRLLDRGGAGAHLVHRAVGRLLPDAGTRKVFWARRNWPDQ